MCVCMCVYTFVFLCTHDCLSLCMHVHDAYTHAMKEWVFENTHISTHQCHEPAVVLSSGGNRRSCDTSPAMPWSDQPPSLQTSTYSNHCLVTQHNTVSSTHYIHLLYSHHPTSGTKCYRYKQWTCYIGCVVWWSPVNITQHILSIYLVYSLPDSSLTDWFCQQLNKVSCLHHGH